jgi:hypothetical protein
MSWFKTGYDAADTAYDDLPDRGPRRVWMPADATNRFLFLDDEPFCFWEHQFQMNGSWLNWEPCKVRNKMESHCVVCDRYPDRYPYFVGYHSVISLTPWTSDKNRTYCFGRQMYGAKLGGKDKPGVLKKLQRIKDLTEIHGVKKNGGRMRGLIIEARRTGSKTETVGDELTVIDQIDPDAVVAWVKAQIAPHLEVVNEQGLAAATAKGEADKYKEVTMEKFLEWNPIEPFDFEKLIEPRSNSQLLSLLGGGSGSSEQSSGGDSGGGSESGGLDDDIPY